MALLRGRDPITLIKQLFDDLSRNFRETDIKVIHLHLLRIDLPSKTRYKHTTAHTSLNFGAASCQKHPSVVPSHHAQNSIS